MTTTTFFIIFIPILSIILLLVNLALAPHNPKLWSGKSIYWDKLSNSGDTLRLLVLSNSWKTICGWNNYSGKVTSQEIIEKVMGYRGSKSVVCENITVKEQRVDGCRYNTRFL